MTPKQRVFWYTVIAKMIVIILIGLFVLLMGVLLSGCSQRTCYPTRGSKDYAAGKRAWHVDKITFNGAQYVLQMHRFENATRIKQTMLTNCLPDSVGVNKTIVL